MYHIKDDPRSIRSAQLIGEALMKCLETTNFSRITITQLQETAGIGRATFYRAFDNLNDVLTYLSDEVYRKISEQIKERGISSARQAHLLFFEVWMKEDRLLETVIEHCGIRPFTAGLLQDNEEIYSSMFPQMSEKDLQYAIPISMNTILIALRTWIEKGKKETPQQLLEILTKSYEQILKHLNEKQLPVYDSDSTSTSIN